MPSDPSPVPLEMLYDATARDATFVPVPLPPALASLYGPLAFPRHPGQPYVISNFVSSLDGVIALDAEGGDGTAINNGLMQDRQVMGLLRACADAVLIGAATLQAIPRYLLTPEAIYRPFAAEYRALRAALGKPPVPLHVVLSGRGSLDLTARIFQSGEVPALIVTTPEGETRIRSAGALPSSIMVAALAVSPSEVNAGGGSIPPDAVLAAITGALEVQAPDPLVLVEGGPRALASFLAARQLDELFLTFSPVVAGRMPGGGRPGFAMGAYFAPDNPRRAGLISAKRAGSALFLRYGFARSATTGENPAGAGRGSEGARSPGSS